MSTPERPWLTLVLAQSADGKISDFQRAPARFGSAADRVHLREQISKADGVLIGAGTLRAYGTSLPLGEVWQNRRRAQNRPPEPVHIICSRSADLDPQLPFFQQPLPRWLLTLNPGGWPHGGDSPRHFERVLTFAPEEENLPWGLILPRLKALGLHRLAVLGGAELVTSLAAGDWLDEIWLTVCPYLLGGTTAPTFLEGAGFAEAQARRLRLLELERRENEVFLHYQYQRD
ncbi:MAG: riboflavin deaminase [Cyanobacteria bacterium RI_101]|nr:riboflavin deaminase [Cyanobacteria bacterium RI_101]